MNCYLCNHESALLFTKSGYQIFRCSHCGLGQTHLGKPYAQFIKDFYTKGYYLGDERKGAYKNYGRDKPYIERNLKSFLSHLIPFASKGKLLDIGCAYGYLVELALSKGFDAYGFDPSSHAVSQAASSIKDRIQHGTLADVSYPQHSFDAITMHDVFEHLADPITDLKKIHTLLKKDGVLMLATGDTGSVAARLLKRRWTFYIPPQHLFFYHKQAMTAVLKAAGFKPVAFYRVGKWLSLSYVLHLAGTSGESRIGSLLERVVERLHLGSLPLFIPLQDNMVVIAKKI